MEDEDRYLPFKRQERFYVGKMVDFKLKIRPAAILKYMKKKFLDFKIYITNLFSRVNSDEEPENNNKRLFLIKIKKFFSDFQTKMTIFLFSSIILHLLLAYLFGFNYLSNFRTQIKWRDSYGNLIENSFGTETWESLKYIEEEWVVCPSDIKNFKTFKEYSTVYVKDFGWKNISHEKILKDTQAFFQDHIYIDCLSLIDFGILSDIVVVNDGTDGVQLIINPKLQSSSSSQIKVSKDYYHNQKSQEQLMDLNTWYDVPEWIQITHKDMKGDSKSKKLEGPISICLSLHRIYYNKCIF
jgi:hypothetical protein